MTVATYICAACGEENEKGWSDTDAAAEFKARFGRELDPAVDTLFCDDCDKLITAWMRTQKMTRYQLLEWLSKEDSSLYGECKGELLDEFEASGLIEIGMPPAGRELNYAPVRLTDAGWMEFRRLAQP